ncbi:NAD(P)/FAD-dependent oxidoreductase [Patulibacter defluvii]|uniref:NAD(P)/FAD-dependent oxidoreductase n=1 Tax=Patulibacter defluvii TaxID=3095358 RepID=UPI002A754C1A|nr:FAD-binding oxidoreductase [Patulibacter sp. DM4]
MSNYEVGIIGAGIHGASVAHHLGRAGVTTALFERETPAAGPTGRSSAVCRAGYTNPFLARMARESIELLGRFGEAIDGADAGFVRTGMLYVHRAEDAGPGLDELLANLEALGVAVAESRPEDHPELRVEPGERLVWEPGAGHADPVGATRGLVDDARRHGVAVHAHTAIAELTPRAAGGARLRTAEGDVHEVERLLIAAGPWTGPLLRSIGVDLPLIVERHVVATFGWGDAPRVPYVLGDVRGGYYLKPEGQEQFGLGSLLAEPQADPDDYVETVAGDESLALVEPAIRRVPGLADAEPAGGWGSLYDVSPDWQPVIGPVADGIHVSAGTSGHGFKLAPALGRRIADLLVGADPDPGLAQFSPERFATGSTLAAGFGAARILG